MNANEALDKNVKRIERSLDKIQYGIYARIDNTDPSKVDWSLVGSMGHVAELLEEAVKFLRNED